MRIGKTGLMVVLGFLWCGCASVEEVPEEVQAEVTVSDNLLPLWVHAADSESPPVGSFSRVTYHPARQGTPLHFRAQPPHALSGGGVLFIRNSRLTRMDGKTGEEQWSVPVDADNWMQVAVHENRITVYEGDGIIRVFSQEGKSLGEWEAMSEALLQSDKDQVYLLSRSGVEAFSSSSLKRIWSWNPTNSIHFLSMSSGNGKIAVEYYSPSIHHHESVLLDRMNGKVRHRFLGKALGWAGDLFYALHDWEGLVWIWSDVTGSFQRTRSLNAFDGRAIFLHDGDVIYSAGNQYFTTPVTRIGPGGMKHEPVKAELRREIQREDQWQVPLQGRAVLRGEVLFDLHAKGVRGWNVADGTLLYEIRMKDAPERVTLGENHLFVLTGSGSLHAFAIRK